MTHILITGANRGIGFALTLDFLRQGEKVTATARNPDAAGQLQALRGEFGNALRIERMDVCDPVSIKRVVAVLEQSGEALDVLVNNAAIFPGEGDERFEDLDLGHLEQAFEVNVVGVARTTQAFLPLLRKSERGRIVNISSGAGSIADKTDSRHLAYSVSKAALNQLSRALAAEFKPEGIIVTPITPGWVRTDMGGENAELAPEESAASLAATIRKLTIKQTGLFLDRHGRSGVYNW